MKVCYSCNKEKSKSEFGKNKNRKDGLHSYCKECTRAKYKEYYKNNREKILKHDKIYREENKELISKIKKRYRDKNMDLLVDIMKRSYPKLNWTDKGMETFKIQYGDSMIRGISLALGWIPKDVYERIKERIVSESVGKVSEEETEKKKN